MVKSSPILLRNLFIAVIVFPSSFLREISYPDPSALSFIYLSFMASPSSSALQRSIASPKIYDVFISHRGPDVKETFAKKLYERLQKRGCRAFLDRKEFEGGDCIPSAIHDAICSSRVQIAIFSKGFAQSSWCLDELVLMLQQRETLFIPVFYGVEPWELRHIDNEKSHYATAFSDYERKGRNLEKQLDEWKNGLVSASYITGYKLSQHENNLCDEIVSRVEKEMKKWIPLHVAKYPVGLAELVQDFERFCTSNRARDKATIVGIFGLGGAGKTTLAKEFFNRKRSSYSASCFLSDVRESHTRHDLHSLQSKLLNKLFGEELTDMNDGIALLRDRLGRARHLQFLIVLDDINHQEQLDALLPEESLSAGSLVIITTRDQNMLRCADASSQYRMKKMDKDRAKELFCRHAFRGKNSPNSIAYEELTDSFVKFCGGLPLSLEVLGAHLYGRTEGYWELQLKKVKLILHEDIMQSLKISFDGLDSQERQIFIDIACFFNKRVEMKEEAIAIWNAAGWSAENAVQTLKEKSLVKINSIRSFEMHDHLRDLGRQIADESGPPRLWHPQAVRSLREQELEKSLAETKVRCFLDDFWDSQNEFSISCFIGSVNDSVEPELLWLKIRGKRRLLEGFRVKPIPSWIPLRTLRCLSVVNTESALTRLDLWSSFQQHIPTNTQASFDLRQLSISNSRLVQKLPDLIRMLTHLEELHIHKSLQNTDPTSLVQSLQGPSNLKLLDLWEEDDGLFSGHLNLSKGGAPNNCAASTSSRMDNLKTITLSRLRNISKLSITGDMCPRLRSLDVMLMQNLNEMDLNELVRLDTLKVTGCPLLKRISGLSTLAGLQSLVVFSNNKLKTISGLSSLTRLQSLTVGRCPELETLSELSPLTEIEVFEIILECGELKSLPSLTHHQHLKRIIISHCQQLHTVHGLKELQGLKSLIIEVPDNPHGYEWLRDCIHGVRRLPSEFTVVGGKPVDDASLRLTENLFSKLIGIQTVVEIAGGENMSHLRGSSNAITIYALLVESCSKSLAGDLHLSTASGIYYGGLYNFPGGCEWMITVIQTPLVSKGMLGSVVRVNRGIIATVNEGEEEKALALLQRIFDQLYSKVGGI